MPYAETPPQTYGTSRSRSATASTSAAAVGRAGAAVTSSAAPRAARAGRRRAPAASRVPRARRRSAGCRGRPRAAPRRRRGRCAGRWRWRRPRTGSSESTWSGSAVSGRPAASRGSRAGRASAGGLFHARRPGAQPSGRTSLDQHPLAEQELAEHASPDLLVGVQPGDPGGGCRRGGRAPGRRPGVPPPGRSTGWPRRRGRRPVARVAAPRARPRRRRLFGSTVTPIDTWRRLRILPRTHALTVTSSRDARP